MTKNNSNKKKSASKSDRRSEKAFKITAHINIKKSASESLLELRAKNYG